MTAHEEYAAIAAAIETLIGHLPIYVQVNAERPHDVREWHGRGVANPKTCATCAIIAARSLVAHDKEGA